MLFKITPYHRMVNIVMRQSTRIFSHNSMSFDINEYDRGEVRRKG